MRREQGAEARKRRLGGDDVRGQSRAGTEKAEGQQAPCHVSFYSGGAMRPRDGSQQSRDIAASCFNRITHLSGKNKLGGRQGKELPLTPVQ